MEIISKLEQETRVRKVEALDKIKYDDALVFLFDAAVLFEQRYLFLDSTSDLQTATAWLSKLIREVFNKYHLKTPMHTEDEAHLKLMTRLSHLKEKGFEKSLVDLCHCYEELERLENLKQIQKYDGNCEVKEYAEGCIITRVREGQFDHFQNYIRDGLKYHALTEFYLNKGRYIAFELVRSKAIEVKGTNEDDQADSFDHIVRQIATREFLQHYSVEENFTLKDTAFRISLLIQILSFLSVYSASRYGHFWEDSAKEPDVIKRIFGVWKSNAETHNQMAPGPLYIDYWDKTVERLKRTIGEYSLVEIERHLDFFTLDLDANGANPNLIEKPLLRMGSMVMFFARPLIHQNSWLPILFALIKPKGRIQPEGANNRITSSTETLAQKFQHHYFSVQSDLVLVNPETSKKVTDIDIIALKDNCLVLVQLKMTHPRATLQEARDHRYSMEKAGEQMVKSIAFLKEHWGIYRHKLGTENKWSDFEIIPLVVSTSFEYDREQFSGYLKISQFELERYLENDAFLFHLAPERPTKPIDWEKEYLFYPVGEKITGELLKALIDSNALWQLLEPAVLAKRIDALLPELCLSGSRAQKSRECHIEGDDCYNKGDFIQAEKMYREAISYFPHHEAYYKGLGNALSMQGKRKDSLEHFDKAIAINPCYGEVFNARGLTFQELEMYEEAYRDFKQAIRYSPSDMTAWAHIASLQLGRGQIWQLEQFLMDGVQYATMACSIFEHLPVEAQEKFEEVAYYLATISSLQTR